MLIPNKRRMLAGGLQAAGLLRVLGRAARRPCLVVLGYHRIGAPSGRAFDGVVSASPEGFERHLRDLRRHFRPLGLDELLDAPESGFDFDGPRALVTFDDGYRDNHEHALPVLEALGVPAAFFLPTGYFERRRLFWWDHVAELLRRTRLRRLVLDVPAPRTFDLDGPGRAAALDALIRLFLDGAVGDEASFLSHVQDRAEVDLDAEALGDALLMRWEHVRELADAGMAIGSHGHDHLHLARLGEAERARELSGSKRILEAALGRPVEAIAYPYGTPEAIDEPVKLQARRAGYRLGFAFQGGINLPGSTDPMALRRVNVGHRDTPAMLRARLLGLAALGRSWT